MMQSDLAELNREAINSAKVYMDQIAWPTVLMSLVVVSALFVTLLAFVGGWIPAWLATLLVGALTYMSYTPLHEAVHSNIGGRSGRWSWLNALCGYLCAPVIAVPYESHRLEHFTHHRYTNQEGKDPDYMVSAMGGGAMAALLCAGRFFYLQNTYFLRHGWADASLRARGIYIAELMVSLGWRVAVLLWLGSLSGVIVVLGGYFIGAFFTAYWFAYRPHHPYQDHARYRNTSSLIMPVWMKPLEWFWLGQNLHSIHHLFPRVPFYRYHALHRDIEHVMRAHGTPIIGVYSRQPVGAVGTKAKV